MNEKLSFQALNFGSSWNFDVLTNEFSVDFCRLNAQWHTECFVCRDCHQPFIGGSFYDHEGMPYCETHYHAKRGSLCAACGKPVVGKCVTAMFRKYHIEHFVCSFCLKQLNKGVFKEERDKPYCHACFDKLFGWTTDVAEFRTVEKKEDFESCVLWKEKWANRQSTLTNVKWEWF